MITRRYFIEFTALLLLGAFFEDNKDHEVYRCNDIEIYSEDKLLVDMAVISTIHGDFGSIIGCKEKFGIGYESFILSDNFKDLRVMLAKQAQGESLKIKITGLAKFNLSQNKTYPGTARFISINSWEIIEGKL